MFIFWENLICVCACVSLSLCKINDLFSKYVGENYDHGHFCRAVCCRVYDVLQESLPPKYEINHPVLSHPNLVNPFNGTDATTNSANWSEGDDKVEIINGNSGRAADM